MTIVKALEWVEGSAVLEAHTSIGEYLIEDHGRYWSHDRYFMTSNRIGIATKHPSMEAAKAAAQADYEARIISALTPAPDLASENESLPQDVVNLVIAAREFWDVAMDESDESAALDCALEAFSSRVPYENDPAARAYMEGK